MQERGRPGVQSTSSLFNVAHHGRCTPCTVSNTAKKGSEVIVLDRFDLDELLRVAQWIASAVQHMGGSHSMRSKTMLGICY